MSFDDFTCLDFLPIPIRKLSGLMSLCKKPLECMYSILEICGQVNKKDLIIN